MCSAYYGEDASKFSFDSFLGLFASFLQDYKQCEIEAQQRAELAEKERKNQLEKEKRAKEMVSTIHACISIPLLVCS